MNGAARTPTTAAVIAAIARREIQMALKRRLVKLLFLGNLIPPLVMAGYLIINRLVSEMGVEDLGWDPLARLLEIQSGPVLLLALGIGVPLVSRDRAEDVLFLYATRPVTPWSYTIGKMLAVAVPAGALLFLPSLLMAILHFGLVDGFGLVDSAELLAKATLAAVLLAAGFSGVTVGSSAAVKKARWALLLAFACFLIPNSISELIYRNADAYAFDVGTAADDLIATLFDGEDLRYGVVAGIVLAAWGALGLLVTSARVRREMIP
jgi:ABC-type transport system involved in multi-copper enzyme maturation permease subunit